MTFRSVSLAQRALSRALGIFLLLCAARLNPACFAQTIPIEEEPEEVPQINTAAQLWAGYDPKAEPLEVEVVKKETQDGIDIETIRYTGETWKGRKVRVFAYRAAPKDGKNLPCIVHLHGGGQTASKEWVVLWAQRGYLATSHDFCGQRKGHEGIYTEWNGVPGEMANPVYPGQKIHPSPRYSSWYHWVLLGRRAITLLQDDPRADPTKVGVYGISVGGTLTWMVAGCDDRVTAAAPIYGVGQNTYDFPWQNPEDPEFPEDTIRWRTLMEPDGYASGVKCPILWINASNDHHGRLDLGMRTLDMTTQSAMLRMVFTPRTIHSIGHEEAPDLLMWMDHHLKGKGPEWPDSPKLVVLEGESPTIQVRADKAEEVESVKIYYGLNNPWPTNRFYRTLNPLGISTRSIPPQIFWNAQAPVLSAEDTIYTFANVHYKSGIVLSTRLVIAPIKDMPNIKPTLKRSAMIDPMDDSEGFFWWLASTDPIDEKPYFKPWTGPNGEKGFTSTRPMGFSYATTALGDPQWKSEGTQPMMIDLFEGGKPEQITVQLKSHFFIPGQLDYEYKPDLGALPAPKNGWITLRFVPGDFKDAAGKPLESWKDVNFLWLTGEVDKDKQVVFKNLRWEELQ